MQFYLLLSSPKLEAESLGPQGEQGIWGHRVWAKRCPPCCMAQTDLGLARAWFPHLLTNMYTQGWEKQPKGEGQKDQGP